MDYSKIAKDILDNIGGKDNIKELTHCMTRLRFKLNNSSKANKDIISKLEGVITVVESMGQFQVVIGNKVTKVYDEIIKLLPESIISNSDAGSAEKQSIGNLILSGLAGIFTPTIAGIAGSGMIKGILSVLSMLYMSKYGIDIKTSQNYIIFNAIADSIFYFMPIMLGYSAAKVFKTSETISMMIGGTLCYPAFVALMTGKDAVTFLGLPVTKATYTSSVIPIIIAVWMLSYVEKMLKKYIPDVLKVIMIPTFALIIMVPATLIIFGPIGIYLGNAISFVYKFAYEFSPVICGAFLGGAWCILVVFGAHRALVPIGVNDVAQTGKQNLLCFAGAANFGQAGAALGVFFKTKNKQLKTIAMSASVTALFGITEPAIYGVTLRLKKPLVCGAICGAIGGGIMGLGGSYGNAFANQGILTIPVYAEAGGIVGFLSYLAGCAIAFFGSAILTYIIGFEDLESDDNKVSKEISANNLTDNSSSNENFEITSPLEGKVIPLTEVKDDVFSSNAMGNGVALIPTDGIITAPADCTVVSIFPTLHAIGLKLNNGAELLIHIGVNTVELKGKYFEAYVKQGNYVKKGDKLLSFDVNKIKEAGYDITTPVIVTNTGDFADVITFENEHVSDKDIIISLVK